MKQIINVFIEGKEVELAQPLDISMTYQEQDFTNPTVVKVGYSKTLSIQGTPNNNKIFGEIWNIWRNQSYHDGDYSGVYFDPSKRASCQIYHNRDLIEDGYVKMNNISLQNNVITYNLTYYSGLADFFYSMSYDEEGRELTLADLDYVDGSGNLLDLDFPITKDTVMEAWNSLRNGHDNKWGVINFAPAYNGKPNELSTDAALINFYGDHSFPTTSVTKDGKTYTTSDGFALATLEKDYTEWEMRDLRSYLQRPVISVKGLWRAFVRKANALGWEVEMDKTFFSEDNPYYASSWMTLPQLSSLEGVGGLKYEADVQSGTINVNVPTDVMIGNLQCTTNPEMYIPVDNNVINLSNTPFGNVECNVNISLSANSNKEGDIYLSSEKTEHYYVWYDGDSQATEWDTVLPVGLGRIMVQLLAYDGNNNVIAGSSIYTFSNSTKNNEIEPGESSDFSAPSVIVDGYFKGAQRLFTMEDGQNEFTLQIAKLPKEDNVRFAIKVTVDAPNGYSTSQAYSRMTWNSSFEGYWDEEVIIPVTFMNPTFSARTEGGNVSFEEYSTTNSGTKITKQLLLQGMISPFNYILSYTKHFGLYWVKDDYCKKVYVYTRNTFYNGEIKVIDEFIDHSRGQSITPITFNSKFYDMQLETLDSDFHMKYKNSYGIPYGRQRLNTGYNFDASANDLFSGNKYKGAVMGTQSSAYFRSFRNGSYVYPSALYDGLSYQLVNGADTVDVDASMASYNYVNWNFRGGYDVFAKPSFQDINGAPIDGSSVLLFFNGFKDTKDVNGGNITFWLTDDLDKMYKLNDEHPCWLITESENDNDGHKIALALGSLPSFSRYFTNGNTILKSWDFGEPLELYVDEQSSDSSTIYSQYWRRMLTDQFNINARVLDTYVLLDRKVLGEMLRNIYYFKNTFWILNKISDYNICSYKPTKCQFIKVQDIKGYTDGQIAYTEKDPVSFNVTTNLTNASYNGPTTVKENTALQAEISIHTGYELYNALIMMENQDITAEVFNRKTGMLNIPRVTGDVSITVEARETVNGVFIDNLSVINRLQEREGLSEYISRVEIRAVYGDNISIQRDRYEWGHDYTENIEIEEPWELPNGGYTVVIDDLVVDVYNTMGEETSPGNIHVTFYIGNHEVGSYPMENGRLNNISLLIDEDNGHYDMTISLEPQG